MKHSKDIADLKAVNMNLMHSNLTITDGVYGVLSTADVRQHITELGQQLETVQTSQEDIADQLFKLAMQLKNVGES
ncbi:MAG: hypothetical protein ABSE06_13755 [Anaerolineaceae bacterium]